MTRFATRLTGVFAVVLLATAAVAQEGAGPSARDEDGRRGPDGPGRFRPPLLSALDADGDGELSAQEIESAVKAVKSLDKNNDGKVTRDELMPAGGRGDGDRRSFDRDRPQGGDQGRERGREGRGGREEFNAERFMGLDKNRDGKVSKEEVPQERQRIFEVADTNKDGAIDKAEAEAMAQRRGEGGRARGEERRGRDGGGQGRPEGDRDRPADEPEQPRAEADKK